MKTLTEFFSGSWVQSMGWTLLHSVWQGALLLIAAWVVLRLIPSSHSAVRYRVAVAALLLMMISSIATFKWHQRQPTPVAFESMAQPAPFHTVSITSTPEKTNSLSGVSFLSRTEQIVQSNMSLIIALWMAGAFVFSLRLIGGWVYVHNLRREALEIHDAWAERIRQLAAQLNVHRDVTLAESVKIHAPIVMGYLKPVILIPLGMMEGLSTEQLETIFIHELTHIRRHDYLVNVLQTLIEAIYFFNPFVWILSGIIRTEREHCCDDTVVQHSNAIVYARALAQLEESRLHREGLALSLAENKHQLLNRIKRIMEKSVKNSPGRERIVPAVLLIVGLMCASWLTIHTGQEDAKHSGNVAADTVKKPKAPKKTTIIINEDVVPAIEGLEPLEGLAPLEPIIAEDFEMNGDFNFDMPFDFPVVVEVPEFPEMSGFDFEVPPTPMIGFNFDMDTIPGAFYYHDGNWEKFSEEFETTFKEKFGDFYKQHEEDFEKMMTEMHEKMEQKFEHSFEMREDLARMDEREQQRAFQYERQAMGEQERAMRHARDAQERAGDVRERHAATAEAMERAKADMERSHEHMKVVEQNMKRMEERMKQFEKSLKEQLIKDKYIGKDDKIENIHWKKDGTIEINGKEIKQDDLKKYNDLHDKFFEKGGSFHYVE